MKKAKSTNITNFTIFDFESGARETERSGYLVKVVIRASVEKHSPDVLTTFLILYDLSVSRNPLSKLKIVDFLSFVF